MYMCVCVPVLSRQIFDMGYHHTRINTNTRSETDATRDDARDVLHQVIHAEGMPLFAPKSPPGF